MNPAFNRHISLPSICLHAPVSTEPLVYHVQFSNNTHWRMTTYQICGHQRHKRNKWAWSSLSGRVLKISCALHMRWFDRTPLSNFCLHPWFVCVEMQVFSAGSVASIGKESDRSHLSHCHNSLITS